MEKISEAGLHDLYLYKLDDYSVVVYKENGHIEEVEEALLRGTFNFTAAWHRDYCLRFIRSFELLGIPIHFCTEENIRRLSGSLGIVNEVHLKKYSFASVEVKVTMESTNPNHMFHNMLIVKDSIRSYQVQVKEVLAREDEEEITVLSKNPTHGCDTQSIDNNIVDGENDECQKIE